jgi:hypothetical protein
MAAMLLGVVELWLSHGRPETARTRGVPELGHRSWPGLLCGSLVLVDEAAEDGSALDPLLGEISDGVVGPGRVEPAAAVKPPSVVMSLVTRPGSPVHAARRR